MVNTAEFETLCVTTFENHLAVNVPMSILFQSGFARAESVIVDFTWFPVAAPVAAVVSKTSTGPVSVPASQLMKSVRFR